MIVKKKIYDDGRDIDNLVLKLAREIKQGYTIIEVERPPCLPTYGYEWQSEPRLIITLLSKKKG